jgi:glycosyltransferase involved in cell wall biosynthesis
MISVIIPTYKEPEVLDLCLKSAIEGQKHHNQIIVVIDGLYNLNKEVLEKCSEVEERKNKWAFKDLRIPIILSPC